MRKSKAETAESRKRIVETASRLFRRDGIHATGLADVMAAAGMTNGGFYRHFDSKDQLVAEAVDAGYASLAETVKSATQSASGKQALRKIVQNYLATKHRDDPGGGCPFTAMGIELSRGSDETRQAASDSFFELVDEIAHQIPRKSPEAARSDAIFMISAMMGALTMSRIVPDDKTSRSILKAVEDHLIDP